MGAEQSRECHCCPPAAKLHKVHGSVTDAKHSASCECDDNTTPREFELLRVLLDTLDAHPAPAWRRADELLLLFNHLVGAADGCMSVPGYSEAAVHQRLAALLPVLPTGAA